MAVHLLASQVLVAATTVPFVAWLQYTAVTERMDVLRQVETTGLKNAVVILKSGTGVLRPIVARDLLRNGVGISGTVIYTLDCGGQNVHLIDSFPDRDFWVYERKPNAREGTLKKTLTPQS